MKSLLVVFVVIAGTSFFNASTSIANDNTNTLAEAVAQQPVSELESEVAVNSPYYKDVTISPDGQLIAALVANNGRYNLALFDRQQLTRAYYVTDFTDADIDSYQWVNNQYLVFSIDFTEQGGNSLYAVARDGEQPIYTIAEGKINASGQVISAEVAALMPAIEDQLIIRYNRSNPEKGHFYRVRVSDGRLLERVPGVPESTLTAWFSAKGEPKLVLREQEQGLALLHLYQDKPELVLESTREPFELMPLALAATEGQIWVQHQPHDQPSSVHLYDAVNRAFVSELSALKGRLVSNLAFASDTAEPLMAFSEQRPVWLNSKEHEFYQQLQLLFPQKNVRELSRSNDANWLTILVSDENQSQSYYLVDRQTNVVSLLFIADEHKANVKE